MPTTLPSRLACLLATFTLTLIPHPDVRAQSKLMEWLHGSPATPPKAPPPKVEAKVSVAAGVTTDPRAESFLRALAAGLKARDATAVLPMLASDYRVDGLPSGTSPKDTFRQAVERMKSPAEIVINQVSRSDAGTTVQAAFHFNPDDIKTRTLKFNPAGQLLSSDLFKIQIHGAGH